MTRRSTRHSDESRYRDAERALAGAATSSKTRYGRRRDYHGKYRHGRRGRQATIATHPTTLPRRAAPKRLAARVPLSALDERNRRAAALRETPSAPGESRSRDREGPRRGLKKGRPANSVNLTPEAGRAASRLFSMTVDAHRRRPVRADYGLGAAA